ncbi:hypothetical protein SeLEV6574_g03173 [Synchytrium endobioticum]|uniref:Rho-GAP domain-containing protein n=1 Tax=Synchytrium endobioticum TaxID=286115 RepID=A0A507D5K9_9FUNG|nr:hypothetical protein SeLEV6574_g03173 [Synchytrium endobioticum]
MPGGDTSSRRESWAATTTTSSSSPSPPPSAPLSPLAPVQHGDKLRQQLILDPTGIQDSLTLPQAEAIQTSSSSWKLFQSDFILRKDAPPSALPVRPPLMSPGEKPPALPPRPLPAVPPNKSLDLSSPFEADGIVVHSPEDWTIIRLLPPPFVPHLSKPSPATQIKTSMLTSFFGGGTSNRGRKASDDAVVTLKDLVEAPKFLVNYVSLLNAKVDIMSYRSSASTVESHLLLTTASLDKIRLEPLQFRSSSISETSPLSSLATLRSLESQTSLIIQWMSAIQYVVDSIKSTAKTAVMSPNDHVFTRPPRGSSTKAAALLGLSPNSITNAVVVAAPLQPVHVQTQQHQFVPAEGDCIQLFVRDPHLQQSRTAASLPIPLQRNNIRTDTMNNGNQNNDSPSPPTSPIITHIPNPMQASGTSPNHSHGKPKGKMFGFSAFGRAQSADSAIDDRKQKQVEERERVRKAAAEARAAERDDKRLKKKDSSRGTRDTTAISAASKMSQGVFNSVPNFFRMGGTNKRDVSTDSIGSRSSTNSTLRRIGPKRDSVYVLGGKSAMDIMDGEIPILLKKCIRLVEEIGLDTEGLYRISGSAATVERLRRLFVSDPEAIHLPSPPEYQNASALLDEDLGASNASKQVHRTSSRNSLNDEIHSPTTSSNQLKNAGRSKSSKSLYDNDVHVITGVIKSYLRDGVGMNGRREPVCTYGLYSAFIRAAKMEEWRDKMISYQDLVHELPSANFATLKFICEHLSNVASHSSRNRMNIKNLAIIFGPTLLRPAPEEETMAGMMFDMGSQCAVVEALVEQAEWMFGPIEYEDDDEGVGSNNEAVKIVIQKVGEESRQEEEDENSSATVETDATAVAIAGQEVIVFSSDSEQGVEVSSAGLDDETQEPGFDIRNAVSDAVQVIPLEQVAPGITVIESN